VSALASSPDVLHTSVGDFPLGEYRLRLAGREWSILHTNTLLTYDDELQFLNTETAHLPYGVALWPAAIALAHEVGFRADPFRGARVLELGAGTGLPGIVAASFGARVVQTDRHEVAMYVCRRNGERNGLANIEYRVADWEHWPDPARYDCILASDVLYARAMHSHLRRILASNLAPGGRILLADPLREAGIRFLEALEADGWTISMTKWNVGEEATPRPIGVFEVVPPQE
jgi:predicted nicotinamide N-methyase